MVCVTVIEKGENEGDQYTPMLNDMITVTPAFLGKLVITLKRYDSSTVISLACSRLQDSRESRSKNVERKPRRVRGAGRDGEVDLLVYPMIRQF